MPEFLPPAFGINSGIIKIRGNSVKELHTTPSQGRCADDSFATLTSVLNAQNHLIIPLLRMIRWWLSLEFVPMRSGGMDD